MSDRAAWICRCLDALWNLGDLLAADEIYDTDYLAHTPSGPCPQRGPESAKSLVVRVRTVLADVRYVVDGVVAGDDRMAIRWTLHGTDTGAATGRLPTGRRVTVRGITLVRLGTGMIVEAWDSPDLASWLPEPAARQDASAIRPRRGRERGRT